MLEKYIPESWIPYLKDEIQKDYFKELDAFVEREYASKTIYPTKENIFSALNYISPTNVKVVLTGQDPYVGKNQAHGLSFSVQDGIALPKSLQNIFKELQDDIGYCDMSSGNLEYWARQGVLLLNSVLTVEEGLSNSHKDKGWEIFTSKILEIVLKQSQPKVFILWGKQAETTFYSVYNHEQNVCIIKSSHPSPLAAHISFFGSKPFSKTNQYLIKNNLVPINWTKCS